jgi:tripartite-type tricarboxylate transporter receptor subunit TctC
VTGTPMPSRWRLGAAIAVVVCASPVAAQVSDYPSKPVRIVVPQAPGGAVDLITRFVGDGLRRAWNQPVVVENRPGAGGNLAVQAVAKSPGDGYNLLVIALTLHLSAHFAKLSGGQYGPIGEFTPVVQFVDVPYVIIAKPNAPFGTVPELVAYAKANPGKLNYGSFGTAQGNHIASELFALTTGTKLTHIPYKGGAPSQLAVVSGEVDVMLDPSAQALINSGKVGAIAVTSSRRSNLLPKLPTVAESGYPGFHASTWTGIAAPAGTPREIVDRINREANRALFDVVVREKMLTQFGQEPVGGTPERFETTIRESMTLWTDVIKRTGIRPQE